MERPFAVMGFSALFVLILLFFVPETWIFAAIAFFAIGLVLALLLHKRGQNTSFIACFGSALLAAILLLAQLGQSYYPALESTGEQLEIRAVITGNGEARYGRYYYALRTVSVGGEAKRLKLRFSSRYPLYAQPYDEISYTGEIYMLGEDDPDYSLNHKAKGVYLGSYAQEYGEDPVAVTPTGSLHPMKYVLLIQRFLLGRMQQSYPDDPAALLRGMLLGDDTGLSWGAGTDFRIAGISHIFSVSGMHMSVLAWSVYRALLAFRLKRRAAGLLGCGFVLFFMALTGFEAACVRAGLMMIILLGGELLRRKANALNSLGLAALLLVFTSPLSAGQLSLQLSFAATLGILLFQERLCAPGRRRLNGLPQWLRRPLLAVNEGLCLTAAAMVLLLPVSLLRMPGGYSLLTFPANLFLVPLSSPAMILSGLAALLPLRIFIVPARVLAQWILAGVHWIGGLPAPMLQGDVPFLAILFGLCALFAAAALLLNYRGRPLLLRYTAGALCLLVGVGAWLPGWLGRKEVQVTRLDTGEGVSFLVSQEGRAALLGCGGDEFPAWTAKQALQMLGIRELEVLLLPGEGEALAAGAPELRRDVPIARLMEARDWPEGYTKFELWGGLTAILYKEGGSRACLLEWSGEVLLFSGELPREWR